MGEAARRRRLGFDGRRMGDAVLAALNQDAGGDVWGLVKGAAPPTEFMVLGAEDPEVRAAFITNAEAAETPHRVVGQVLIRRGEPWLEAIIFDPCETYRAELYAELGVRAVRIAHELMDGERVDEVWHDIVSSTFPGDAEMLRTAKSRVPAPE
ncbi:MAG TPA: hypothetical protein VEQ60_17470 [Longimicrobium sp.]|nr:hypothetical protein [Longimicrobium sp.]